MARPEHTNPHPSAGLSAIIESYDAVICDLWGVIHGGGNIYPWARECLLHLSTAGVPLLLLSNSPRPAWVVKQQLEQKGLEPDLFSHVVSSGELTRRHLAAKEQVGHAFHMGWNADRVLFEGLALSETEDPARADFVICSGFMAGKTPDLASHQSILERLLAAGAPMLCANPDKVVEVGGKRFFCAGTLADQYEVMGGEVLRFGKPESAAYDYCLSGLAADLDQNMPRDRVLCIGDNMETDILGAKRAGCHALLITSGIHKRQMESDRGKISSIDKEPGVEDFFSSYDALPDWTMQKLVWAN